MSGMLFDEFALTGRARWHVRQYGSGAVQAPGQPRFASRPEVAEAFLAMRAAAARDGIDMVPIASWRPFEAQARNWNRKFSGQATLYDCLGRPRDSGTLAPPDVVRAILNWTGLPGASRRHWGTDIDVFDRAAQPPGYKTKLLPDEAGPDGVYAHLHAWLDANAARFGFFRPYRTQRRGMCPEPWHLSFAPSAEAALAMLDIDMVARAVRASDLLGRELVLDMLPEIFRDHVQDADRPAPPGAARPSSWTGTEEAAR
jgi:LAS superfamily LD-carboxypeptidase LdcB